LSAFSSSSQKESRAIPTDPSSASGFTSTGKTDLGSFFRGWLRGDTTKGGTPTRWCLRIFLESALSWQSMRERLSEPV
jgi:hypothetical protein